MSVNFMGQITVAMEEETCCNCGVLFAMTREVKQRFLREGGTFYCTNGHGQHYTKNEVQRLKEDLIREKSACEQAQAEANYLRDKNFKINGKLSRVYKRVRNGVCPCCNRHFSNLEGHMKTKHGTGAQKSRKPRNAGSQAARQRTSRKPFCKGRKK